MARPQKNNALYFSHDSGMRDDERIKAVRRKFSHTGYSIWNMLLERLCDAQFFKVEYSDDTIDIMAGDFDIDPDQLKEIIDYLIKLRLIQKEENLIFSQRMINTFESLLKKRVKERKEDIVSDKPNNKAVIAVDNSNQDKVIAVDNTQSKIEENRVNKNKENHTQDLREAFFKDLPNSTHLETISTDTGVAKDQLIKMIPDFRKVAEVSYPDYARFCSHFKNWVNKSLKLQTENSSNKTSVSFGKAKN